eukprot:CAMPEP_0184498498 /NCGR_PEP_ID=MMETSP0113_2-20130426/39148_1 /TAXON_ID=91329 /ORGANISM="Norrisiella sphaerica, Strain BC52" /LENGTH=1058 /DNA_ID=CAMNT_0026886037 /DNA_START=161 /DNA_END=3337 /DNA_ORIENTATION=+
MGVVRHASAHFPLVKPLALLVATATILLLAALYRPLRSNLSPNNGLGTKLLRLSSSSVRIGSCKGPEAPLSRRCRPGGTGGVLEYRGFQAHRAAVRAKSDFTGDHDGSNGYYAHERKFSPIPGVWRSKLRSRCQEMRHVRVCGKRKKANPHVLDEKNLDRKMELVNWDAVEEFEREMEAKSYGTTFIKPDPDAVRERQAGEEREIYDLFDNVITAKDEGYQGPGSRVVSVSQMMQNVESATLFHHYAGEVEAEMDQQNKALEEALKVLEEKGEEAFRAKMKKIYGTKADAVIAELKDFARMDRSEVNMNPYIREERKKAPLQRKPSRPGYSGDAKAAAAAEHYNRRHVPHPGYTGKVGGDAAAAFSPNRKKKKTLMPKPETPFQRRLALTKEINKKNAKVKEQEGLGPSAETLPMPKLQQKPSTAPETLSAAAAMLPGVTLKPEGQPSGAQSPLAGASAPSDTLPPLFAPSLPGALPKPGSTAAANADSGREQHEMEHKALKNRKKSQAASYVQISIPDKKQKRKEQEARERSLERPQAPTRPQRAAAATSTRKTESLSPKPLKKKNDSKKKEGAESKGPEAKAVEEKSPEAKPVTLSAPSLPRPPQPAAPKPASAPPKPQLRKLDEPVAADTEEEKRGPGNLNNHTTKPKSQRQPHLKAKPPAQKAQPPVQADSEGRRKAEAREAEAPALDPSLSPPKRPERKAGLGKETNPAATGSSTVTTHTRTIRRKATAGKEQSSRASNARNHAQGLPDLRSLDSSGLLDLALSRLEAETDGFDLHESGLSLRDTATIFHHLFQSKSRLDFLLISADPRYQQLLEHVHSKCSDANHDSDVDMQSVVRILWTLSKNAQLEACQPLYSFLSAEANSERLDDLALPEIGMMLQSIASLRILPAPSLLNKAAQLVLASSFHRARIRSLLPILTGFESLKLLRDDVLEKVTAHIVGEVPEELTTLGALTMVRILLKHDMGSRQLLQILHTRVHNDPDQLEVLPTSELRNVAKAVRLWVPEADEEGDVQAEFEQLGEAVDAILLSRGAISPPSSDDPVSEGTETAAPAE